MISKIHRKFLFAAVGFMFVCAGIINAQEAAPQQQQVTPEKRALIKEILELTGGKKSVDTLVDVMFAQMDQEMPKTIALIIEQHKNFTPEEKKQMQNEFEEMNAQTSKRFRELLTQKVDFSQLIEDITVQVYGKHFTENELKDIIAFYKSPTGQKMITIMPELLGESMAKASEALQPVMEKFLKEAAETEITQFTKEKKEKSVKKKQD